jgi:hypothetical protein
MTTQTERYIGARMKRPDANPARDTSIASIVDADTYQWLLPLAANG